MSESLRALVALIRKLCFASCFSCEWGERTFVPGGVQCALFFAFASMLSTSLLFWVRVRAVWPLFQVDHGLSAICCCVCGCSVTS